MVLQEIHSLGKKAFMLAGDASKAHRRIKVKREGWGLQACRLEAGKFWRTFCVLLAVDIDVDGVCGANVA